MVSKSTVDAYNLRLPHGYQCQIIIEEQEKAGRVTIVSEFGNWSMYWGACHIPFLDFLADLDIEYFATKVGEKKNKVSKNFQRFWEIAWIPFVEYIKAS